MTRRAEIEALTPRLRRYARGLTGNVAAADDLAQDAILSALRSSGLGRGPALRRRLYAILTDFNRLRATALPEADAYGGDERGIVAPFARAVRTDDKPVALDPLAALALAEREALLLVAVEGFGYDEAADIAGVSRPALIARLARARGAERQACGVGRGEGAPARRHLRLVS